MQEPSISYILKLSIPIFFANLAIPMVGIIDTALMGNLGNLSYLSATSVAANLFSMIFWSFGFLRMGTVGMVSQANGKEDFNEITNIVTRNLLFVLIISPAFSAGSSGGDAKPVTQYEIALKMVDKAKKFEKKNKTEKAQKHYQKAIGHLLKHNKEFPADADTLNYLGFTHRKVGDYENAESITRWVLSWILSM